MISIRLVKDHSFPSDMVAKLPALDTPFEEREALELLASCSIPVTIVTLLDDVLYIEHPFGY